MQRRDMPLLNNLKKLGFTQQPYAIGIPEKGRFTELRSIQTPKTEMWNSVLHAHEADRAGYHEDLRIHDPQTDVVYSFVVQNMPAPGEKVLAVRQQDHSPEAMTAVGIIPAGYGKGTIKQLFSRPTEILKSEPGKMNFVTMGSSGTPERYTLIKPSSFENNNWLLLNTTPTRQTRQIPTDKPKYPHIDPNKIDFNNPNEKLSPKLDGAHNLFVIRPNKPIETFSYRKSKKTNTLIDHTFKTDLYKTKGSPELKNETIVRGELIGIKKDKSLMSNTDIAGILNSGTLRSRELQKEKGKLQPYIFDVVRFNGKDVSNLPYAEKLVMLGMLSNLHPQFQRPQVAETPLSKRRLFEDIKSGHYPLPSEGLVIYKNDSPVPIKAPFVKSTEVEITGFFPAEKGSKYHDKAVGGYEAQFATGGPKIRIGSGLDDKTRIDMYINPNKYIGNLATITYKNQLPSGLFRVPIHKTIRTLW